MAGVLLHDGWAPSLAGAFAALWWVAVVVVVRSDLEDFIIPDGASAGIAGLALLYACLQSWAAGFTRAEVLSDGGAAALVGFGAFAAFWLVARLYRLLSGREGLGFGDVKLAGASAMWLTPSDAALTLETAAVAGLLVLLWHRWRTGSRDMALPFGAFLAPAAWLAFVVGPMLHVSLEHLG